MPQARFHRLIGLAVESRRILDPDAVPWLHPLQSQPPLLLRLVPLEAVSALLVVRPSLMRRGRLQMGFGALPAPLLLELPAYVATAVPLVRRPPRLVREMTVRTAHAGSVVGVQSHPASVVRAQDVGSPSRPSVLLAEPVAVVGAQRRVAGIVVDAELRMYRHCLQPTCAAPASPRSASPVPLRASCCA